MSTTLAHLLATQADQQGLWYNRDLLTDAERAAALDELLLGLHEETTELARVLRRKPHVGGAERLHRGNAIEEGVDVLKYLLAIAHLEGWTADQISERFAAKTVEVEQKYKQRQVALAGQRVFVSDLDSCVADLAPFFSATGGQYGGDKVGTLDTEARKAAWYAGGGFLTLPPIHGARETLRAAKEAGCLVAIVTARPVWEHARVRADTIAWLREQDIPCDLLLFNKDKWDAVYQSILPAQVVGFVEDRDKHIMELVGHKVQPVFLFDQPWNQDTPAHPTVHRVWSWHHVRLAMDWTDWGRNPRTIHPFTKDAR